ncbi:hypothetical protein DFJ77DRAFT_445428 [Powellomyces hirtus]|nr:hypothetical protein DFJ77DRAFT_445428 [Powellomyces hirtus]
MKVLLFGASRGCGLESAVQLVEAGHSVTLFLRDPSKLDARLSSDKINSGLVATVKGDAFNAEDVRAAFKSVDGGPDMVVTSIGGTPVMSGLSLRLEPPKICERAVDILLPIMKESVQKRGKPIRLTVLSSSGLGKIGHQELPLPMKPLYSWVLKEPHADKEQLELKVYHAAGLKHPDASIEANTKSEPTAEPWLSEFILVRPALLTDGARKGIYRADEHLKAWTISRADVGHFVATECIKPATQWLNKPVTIGY